MQIDRAAQFRAQLGHARERGDSVKLRYHDKTRTVIPLAFQAGDRVLCRQTDVDELRSFRLSEIQSAEINPRESDPAEAVETLKTAASHDHCVRMRYRTEKNYVMEVTVEPHGLEWTSQGNLILEGVRSDNGNFRHFRVDRIEQIGETDQQIDPQREVQLEGYALKNGNSGAAPVVLAVV